MRFRLAETFDQHINMRVGQGWAWCSGNQFDKEIDSAEVGLYGGRLDLELSVGECNEAGEVKNVQ